MIMEDKGLMKATPEWMRKKYAEFNDLLFGGKLGDCDFRIFTTGKGSYGKTLGRFRLGFSVQVDLSTRRMHVRYSGVKRYIDNKNFAQICKPIIELNGNYSGSEESLSHTLVHEMCHYADYMYGFCPKQGHGPSFRNIASIVSSRSGGRFDIHRLISAEAMKGYQLDDKQRVSNEKRLKNKKSRMVAVFVYRRNGGVELTLTSSKVVISKICQYYEIGSGIGKATEIITSTDPELIEMLYNLGYNKEMRTWRYWNVGNKSWINTIKNYDYNPEYLGECLVNGSNMLKEGEIKRIIEAVVDDYVNSMSSDNDDDNVIEIGGMNLGLYSPLELIKKQ